MIWSKLDEDEARKQGWNLCTIIGERRVVIKGRPTYKATYEVIRTDNSPFPSDEAARQFVIQCAAGRPNSLAQKALTLSFQSKVNG